MDLDIKTIKKRFLDINRERLRRTQNALRWKQRDFLDVLPIFFHINHAMLPGYVSKNTPAGVSQYTPTKKGVDAVNQISKSFTYKRRALRTYEIQSIFIMGSVGTIAQSEKSDFDIWICHNPDIKDDALDELKLKCNKIVEWSNDLGLEVHFFLMNAEKFKKGEVHELSSESSGTTQHHLLLEEFYRTGLLLAGCYPVWWLVPPEQEHNYDEFVRDLLHKRFIPPSEVIDFGGLASIPAEEFFGAALWQVYKGIDSPYKSVLKILLMETYASAYPNIDLLSSHFKRIVYEGVIDLNRLDPYAILMNRLEQYLLQQGSQKRLELVRRCFYFKVNVPLSKAEKQKDNWRRDMLWAMVVKWEWGDEQLAMLDARDEWKIRKVLHERKILVDELTNSYLFLSNFARENTSSISRISQRDLNILGRKLYAAFERKAGKIELVNRGVSTNVAEQKLTFAQSVGKDGEESWSLIIEFEIIKNNRKEVQQSSLKRSQSIAELIAWCHFNRLINARTVLSVDNKTGILTVKEVKSVLAALENLYPTGRVPGRQIDDFAQSPKIVSGCVFTNVGLDPMPMHSRRGTDIVSDKTDVLNYSGFSFNLALSFDLLLVTSWQEVFIYRHSQVQGLLDCLCQYLRWHLNSPAAHSFTLPSYSFCSSHSTAVAKRIEQLFNDVAQSFFRRGELSKLRYIFEVQKSYYILYVEHDNFVYKQVDSQAELYHFLSQPQPEYIPIKTDRFALLQSILPQVLQKNKPDKIQLFYETVGGNADIFVLDEYGSVFHQSLPFHDDHALLNQFILFFSNVANRQNVLSDDDVGAPHFQDIDYCRVTSLPKGKCRYERKYIDQSKLRKSYFHVQVIANLVDQKPVFTVYCEDQEFSSFDYGKTLFREVAKYVYRRRASGEKYPIYITDLDLAPNLLGNRAASKVQIIEFLNYKKRIEEALNKELQSL
ncbi:MAG: class I adenylate cyclase [Gammaproteobacteria bacterium]|jgi:adenylate cyclase class 1